MLAASTPAGRERRERARRGAERELLRRRFAALGDRGLEVHDREIGRREDRRDWGEHGARISRELVVQHALEVHVARKRERDRLPAPASPDGGRRRRGRKCRRGRNVVGTVVVSGSASTATSPAVPSPSSVVSRSIASRSATPPTTAATASTRSTRDRIGIEGIVVTSISRPPRGVRRLAGDARPRDHAARVPAPDPRERRTARRDHRQRRHGSADRLRTRVLGLAELFARRLREREHYERSDRTAQPAVLRRDRDPTRTRAAVRILASASARRPHRVELGGDRAVLRERDRRRHRSHGRTRLGERDGAFPPRHRAGGRRTGDAQARGRSARAVPAGRRRSRSLGRPRRLRHDDLGARGGHARDGGRAARRRRGSASFVVANRRHRARARSLGRRPRCAGAHARRVARTRQRPASRADDGIRARSPR